MPWSLSSSTLPTTPREISPQPSRRWLLGLIEKAAPTLAATHAISRALKDAGHQTPVLCASGLSSVTVPMAIAAGAAGVGVGSAVNRLSDPLAMVAVVRGLREALGSGVQSGLNTSFSTNLSA